MGTVEVLEAEEGFVEVGVKVEIPKNTYNLLVHLAKFIGNMTVEDILTDELEGLIRDFFSGGYYGNWTEFALEKHIDC